MSDKAGLEMLEIHRANMASASSFEEYRERHVSYIDTLIARMKADIAKKEATIEYCATWRSIDNPASAEPTDE